MTVIKGFLRAYQCGHKSLRLAVAALFLPLFLQGCDEEYRLSQVSTAEPGLSAVTESDLAAAEQAQVQQRGVRRALAQSSSDDERPQGAIAALIEDDQCLELTEAPPRGLACLHCTHENARRQSRIIASLLFRSCLKNVAVNYLVDGTFEFDETLIREHIALLSSGERRVFLYFYLSNGATQRRYRDTSIKSFATNLAPEEFRSRISSDHGLRYQYQQITNRLIPLLRYAERQGAIIHLLPSLEDNLDDASFAALAGLLLETLPNDLTFAVGRSACPGCFSGNEDGVPGGFFTELHTINPSFTLRDGVVTNDGRTYSFDPQPGLPSLEDMKVLRDRAAERNNTFILWSAARQGLPAQTNAPYKHPDERTYEIPSIPERVELLRFLRGE